jgi:hypothetical protein
MALPWPWHIMQVRARVELARQHDAARRHAEQRGRGRRRSKEDVNGRVQRERERNQRVDSHTATSSSAPFDARIAKKTRPRLRVPWWRCRRLCEPCARKRLGYERLPRGTSEHVHATSNEPDPPRPQARRSLLSPMVNSDLPLIFYRASMRAGEYEPSGRHSLSGVAYIWRVSAAAECRPRHLPARPTQRRRPAAAPGPGACPGAARSAPTLV